MRDTSDDDEGKYIVSTTQKKIHVEMLMNYQETGRLKTTAGAARNYFNSYSYFPLKTDDDDDDDDDDEEGEGGAVVVSPELVVTPEPTVEILLNGNYSDPRFKESDIEEAKRFTADDFKDEFEHGRGKPNCVHDPKTGCYVCPGPYKNGPAGGRRTNEFFEKKRVRKKKKRKIIPYLN